MICHNCGKNVEPAQERCSFCGKPTRFSESMHDRPQKPPMPGTKSVAPGAAAVASDEMRAIAGKVDAVARRLSKMPTKAGLWVCTLLVVMSVLATFAVSQENGERRRQAIEALLPTPTPTATPGYAVYFFDNDGGAEGELLFETAVPDGEAYCMPDEAPARSGERFVGWNTRADGRGALYYAGAIYEAGRDLRLYAQWETVATPTPTLTPTPTPTPTPVPQDTPVPLTELPPTPPGDAEAFTLPSALPETALHTAEQLF